MHRLIPYLVGVVVVLGGLCCGQGAASVIFSVDVDSNELVRIDTTTSTLQVVGPVGHRMYSAAMTFHEGKLCAMVRRNAALPSTGVDLLTIDPNTGAKTSEVIVTLDGAPLLFTEGLESFEGKLLMAFPPGAASYSSWALAEVNTLGEVSNVTDFSSFGADFDVLVDVGGDLCLSMASRPAPAMCTM